MILPKTSSLSFIKRRLEKPEWQRQKADHERQISKLIDGYLERRSQQQKDPVMDFLFEYYAFRPAYLRSWSPGFGTLLIDGASHPWRFDEMNLADKNAFLDVDFFSKDRVSSLKWILDVLEQSANRPPSFGCFGMHEWAMVYKSKNIRHDLPLRMKPKELAEFVESRPLVCTHFDAFRFFTNDAKPRNKFELRRETFAEKEQPGCLHTNMDLYKWSFKMYPWISSKTIRKAFELAVETRLVDMKASPYDLRERGLQPIKIETEEGRLEYLEKQRDVYRKSQPIRKRLIKEYHHLLEGVSELHGEFTE
ncbi:MAG TPA: 3-methyladenine DNA glycosylase [Balneolaceae bacterium]